MGADEGIGEDDVPGYPQAMAAKGAFGVPMELGSGPSQHWTAAKRTVGRGGKDLVDEKEEEGEENPTQTSQSEIPLVREESVTKNPDRSQKRKQEKKKNQGAEPHRTDGAV